MKKVTVTGKTVEEAIDKALVELKADRNQIEYSIIEAPQKKILGFIGGKPATLEVYLKPDPVKEAYVFLERVIKDMNVNVTMSKEDEKGQIVFQLKGKEIGILIGKRGQTLDSLQYLVNLVANRYSENYIRILLDAENYRERRKQSLEQLAQRLAKKAVSSQREVILEPMNARERKIIHSTLQSWDQITTYSDGEEPRRRVIISPAERE